MNKIYTESFIGDGENGATTFYTTTSKYAYGIITLKNLEIKRIVPVLHHNKLVISTEEILVTCGDC